MSGAAGPGQHEFFEAPRMIEEVPKGAAAAPPTTDRDRALQWKHDFVCVCVCERERERKRERRGQG